MLTTSLPIGAGNTTTDQTVVILDAASSVRMAQIQRAVWIFSHNFGTSLDRLTGLNTPCDLQQVYCPFVPDGTKHEVVSLTLNTTTS